jgi:nucleoside-diphosphate-sugar epimerase
LDVNDLREIDPAVSGSEIVYVTLGFEYNLKVWQKSWPPFIEAVINACEAHHAKLVFFDNVYMYPRSAIPYMTEDSPWQPPSKKGEIRKKLDEMIMQEVKNNNLIAMIVRAADFYGPDITKSAFGQTVVKNLMAGKSAQVMGDIDKIHTYTFTPDAAIATALLGNTPDAYNQVWHLPTTKELLTNRQWVELVANELNMKPKFQKIPSFMLSLLGLFIPLLKELPEMMYQSEMDYVFDSTKFEKRFGIKATTPKEGVKVMMEAIGKSEY